MGGVPDDDLLSHGESTLSLACCRFTVLFGMGRGGSGRLWSSGVEGSQGRAGTGLRSGRSEAGELAANTVAGVPTVMGSSRTGH